VDDESRNGKLRRYAGMTQWHSHSWLCASTKPHSFNAGTEYFGRAKDSFRKPFSHAATEAERTRL